MIGSLNLNFNEHTMRKTPDYILRTLKDIYQMHQPLSVTETIIAGKRFKLYRNGAFYAPGYSGNVLTMKIKGSEGAMEVQEDREYDHLKLKD